MQAPKVIAAHIFDSVEINLPVSGILVRCDPNHVESIVTSHLVDEGMAICSHPVALVIHLDQPSRLWICHDRVNR